MESDNQQTKSAFDEWALVELFGHARIVGKVTEATIAGGAFIRVDVPNEDGTAVEFTRFFGPSAIYSMSPITKAMALALAKQQNAEPVKRYELRTLEDKLADKRREASEHDEAGEERDGSEDLF